MAGHPVPPEVMIRQAEALAGDLREQAGPAREQVRAAAWPGIEHVVLTGDGDSHHAGCAARMAFETIAGIDCDAVSALPFAAYHSDLLRRRTPGSTLVVATSASGRTERVVEAIERAGSLGARTLAVTVTPGSPVTQAADRSVVLALPWLERSPGIRTYQAGLLALLMLAARLGDQRAGEAGSGPARSPALRSSAPRSAAPRGTALRGTALLPELGRLADIVAATAAGLAEPCAEVARSIAGAPAVMVTGSGPAYGTAMYAAAKLTEGAGMLAVPQDVEEWFHVESHARPADMPVFVIAPAGRSRWRALQLTRRAAALGRRPVVVAAAADEELARAAWRMLPVAPGDVREELSPLVYHVFAGFVACALARELGRYPFQSA